MGTPGVGHLDGASAYGDVTLAADKASEELRGIAGLKPPEFLGEHAVEGIGITRITFDTSDLQAGTYIIRIVSDDGVTARKISVMR